MALVYELFSSAEPERPRYVGITSKSANERLAGHLAEARKGELVLPVYKWIRKHLQAGHVIEARVLCAELSWEQACEFEMLRIAELRCIDDGVLNATNGGEGVNGLVHSKDTRQRIADGHRGVPIREEVKAQISKTLKGRPKSEETKRRMREARLAYIAEHGNYPRK